MEQRGVTVWFTGLSGAGKTTISQAVAEELKSRGYRLEILDGDIVRTNLTKGLGFSKEDRDENIRRIGFVSHLLTRNGVIVFVSAISPYREIRDEVRQRVGDFVEVFVNAPLDVCETRDVGRVEWSLNGQHNIANALAALAAARHAGVPPAQAVEALCRFENVKRRMELRGEVGGVRVYDDFAHHPTAIRLTLQGLRAEVGDRRILAVLEPRSNTMRMGVHAAQLADALQAADLIWVYAPDTLGWNVEGVLRGFGAAAAVCTDTKAIVRQVVEATRPGDQVLIMSNGGFEGIHQRLLDALQTETA